MSSLLIASSSQTPDEYFHPDLRDQINEIALRYPERRSAVMPALHIYQERFGYISQQSMEEIADILDMAPVQVYEVTSFYHHFRTEPVGKYHLKICNNISCMLMGADCLIGHIQQILQLKCDETTRDGMFTLSTAECLGSCDTAPVMQINNDAYCEHLDAEKLNKILRSLENKIE